MEKLAEDMDRQAILERLGWQFVRIRGSAFYRDKELSMRPVFARLAELEIPQEANTDEQPVLYQTDDGTTRVEVRMAGEAIKPL